jgi:shikimate dehydrogenase
MEHPFTLKVDSHTELYGIIGNPVRHSLSPALHNAAFSAVALNAVYLAFEAEDIEGCIEGITGLGVKGMSVTIPFKESVIPCLSAIDPLARRIGAVNTIVNRGGRLTGYNTDAIGALMALEAETSLPGKSCILLGAGGAARAIGFILKQKGASLSIVNRSRGRGQRLARSLECRFISLEEIADVRGDILIQTMPVGMSPHVDQCPVPEVVLRQGMVVMDIIYDPFETRLLRMARERGCTAINGIPMLINQAAEQFRLWTGVDPPLSAMHKAIEEALSKRHEAH